MSQLALFGAAPEAARPRPAAAPKPRTLGEASRFYLGVPEASWAADPRFADQPVCLSYHRIARVKTLWPALTDVVIDSGACTELVPHNGTWSITPQDYAAGALRAAEALGRVRWIAPQDWCCEPEQMRRTGRSEREHQQLTTASVLRLWQLLGGDLHVIPVLQAWQRSGYRRHREAGIDLDAEPVVGVGSICVRPSLLAALVLGAMDDLGLAGRVHAFGASVQAMSMVPEVAGSWDTMAWSKAAMYQSPLPGHTHKRCSSCPEVALEYAARIQSRLLD